MFFDIILLHPQHKSMFGLAWLAATRGIRFVKKKQALAVDIPILCNEIRAYMVSSHYSAKKRFSLRLSSILLLGTARIHQLQVKDLQDCLFVIWRQAFVPKGLSAASVVDSEPTESRAPPVIKTKKPRKPKDKKTSDLIGEAERQLAVMLSPAPVSREDVGIVTARLEEITMREDHTTFKKPFDHQPDLGELSPREIESLFQEMHFIPRQRTSSSSSSSMLGPQRIEVVAQIHATRNDIPIFISEGATLNKEPEVSLEIQPEIPARIGLEREPTKSTSEKTNLLEIESLIQEMHFTPRQTTSSSSPSLMLGPQRIEVVAQIHAPRNDIPIFISEGATSNKEPEVPSEIQPEIPARIELERETTKSTSEEDLEQANSKADRALLFKLLLVKRRTRHRNINRPPFKFSDEELLMNEYPLEFLHLLSLEEEHEDDFLLRSSAIMEQARRSIMEHSKGPQIIEELDKQTPTKNGKRALKRPSGETTPKKAKMYAPEEELGLRQPSPALQIPEEPQEPHNTILDKIKAWNFGEKDLTIEDLTDKPFTRLKISRTFYELLSLSKDGYVLLKPRDDSLELQNILKGPRLMF